MKKIILTFIATLLAGFSTAWAQDVARNKQTGVTYTDLQLAITEATAGNTIELLSGIETVTLDGTIVINKSITIEGGDYQVMSVVTTGSGRLDPAFRITGPGSVTLNKVNLVAPYFDPGIDNPVNESDYPNGSVGILVDNQFSDSLIINYSTITTTSRGIDVQSIGSGFVLDVKHSTITTTDDDPTTVYPDVVPGFDPTKVYINSFEGDPHGLGRGINFGNSATTCVANIQFSKIQGYAYPINVGEYSVNTGKVVLNMTDCSTWGRDVINNGGSHSTFNLKNITAHGYNNELSANNESFAAIVDYKDADYNFYNIEDLRVISNVKASDAANTSASEKFIDLRGTNATVKITGNSGYEIADDLKDRVGFVNTNLSDEDVNVGPTDAYLRMIDTSVNNRIYFDDQAKAYFNYWFEILDWILYNNDSDPELEKIRIAIDDEKDHTNLYPVVPLEVKVMLTITPKGSSVDKDFYFGKLQDAFNSEFFDDSAVITIQADITMDEDITPDLKRGENFTLQIETEDDGNGNYTKLWTLNPAGHNIFLNPLVRAYYEEDNADVLFAPSDDVNTTILGVDGVYYTAANVYWANDVNNIGGDVLYDQYWLFNELFTYYDMTPYFTPGSYTRLEKNLKLERDLKLPTGEGLGGVDEFGENEIQSVINYSYTDYTYKGKFEVVDGSTVNYMLDPDVAAATNGHINDMARFLGALYRAGGVTTITYDWEDYEWDPTIGLLGSNWCDGNGNTLVSVIVSQYSTYVPKSITITTDKGSFTVYINPKQPYWLDFKDYSIEKGDYSIILQLSDTVYTTKPTDIFSSFSPEYTVVYDAVSEEKTLEDGTSIVKFLYKYYLLKDALAITVNPATFCGDRLTPSFVVKKKVIDAVTGNITWVELTDSLTKDHYDQLVANNDDVSGYDYYWYLLPPSDDDDSTYVSAKTYVQALVIEGISFQGTRKVDFTILPRDIKDVNVSGNEQPWVAAGYTPDDIEDLIKLVYYCQTHSTDTALTKYDPTTKKGDYTIEVKDGPGANGTYNDVDTYSKVVTITAVEGGNYTGTMKVDFTILPENLIDISKCMVVSNAVYTSDTLPPTYKRISVIYKKTDNGVEVVDTLDQNQFTIDVHGLSASYVNAKTYSNAITLRGVPENGYYGTLDADYVIKPRDIADSLAVDSENDNNGYVILEAYAGKDATATDPVTYPLQWTGSEIVPVINDTVVKTNNNINLVLKAKDDKGADIVPWLLKPISADLTTYDYSYTIEPSPMIDPGEYKVIFTGRGNFTGMREVKVMVLKDIHEVDSVGVPLQIIPDNILLKPSELQDVIVMDSDKVLVEGVHYTLTVKSWDGATTYTDANPIKDDTLYQAIFTGKEPYYTNDTLVIFPVLFEYYSWDATKSGTNYYSDANSTSNYLIAADSLVSIHVTSGKDLECQIGDKAGLTAVKKDTTSINLPGFAHFSVGTGIDLTVVGIDDNAFNGCDTLHWIDATALKGYTPTMLSRSEDGPFNGYPVQSLVYLDGCSDVIGTNYIYKKGNNDFRCEELKIYDDQQGKQKGFTEGGGPKWEFWNKYEFTADKVTNTRYFLAGQHYTTCLPYKLKVNSDLKVYTLDAASDQIFGFKELSLDSLAHFTPFLLIPSKAGNLLNNEGRTVVYVTPTADQGILNPKTTPRNQATMYGSTIYMDKNTIDPSVTGLYIMQSENKWKKIPADKEYDDACVLPMRAYIQVPVTSPAREYIMGKIIDSVEHPTVEVADDWSNAEVYDLQGRKVDTTARLPKGVYIVNGQKRIRK